MANKPLILQVTLLLMLLLFLIVGLFFYHKTHYRPSPEVTDYSAQLLNQIITSLNTKIKHYEDISFQFTVNQDLNRMLKEYISAKDSYDISLWNPSFSNYLEGHAFIDNSIYDAMFITESNPKRKALTMGEALPYEFVKTFRESEAYRSIVKADGKPVWVPAFKLTASNKYYFMLGRRIKDLYTGKPFGVLVIFIKEKSLDYLINDNSYNNGDLLEGPVGDDYYFIVDGAGRILASPFKKEINRKITTVVARTKSISFSKSLKTARSLLGQVHGKKTTITYQAVNELGWHLISVIPVYNRETKGSAFSKLWGDFTSIILLSSILIVFALLIWGIRMVTLGAKSAKVPESAMTGFLMAQAGLINAKPIASRKPPKWLGLLNEKEKEILNLIAHGHDNKEIAKQLFMAEQTIKNYISNIYSKMDVHDRVQASLKAIEAGLTGSDDNQN